jgi:sterol desaturase/sphingolipid hydroxylase (fatty acid hydroxylase superfamily)
MNGNSFLLEHEALMRLSAFVSVFAVMALWEIFTPRRMCILSRTQRWVSNLGIVVLDSVVVRLLFPMTGVAIAMLADEWGWGILNLFQLSGWIAVVVAVVTLDLAIYLQHVMFHAVPVLWRVHRMHHADLDFDVTTGLRFHPVEIVLSMLIKMAAIALIGAPAFAVVLFEIILNASAMFNHSNVRIPVPVDRLLRWLIVTPDMHRIHHSIAVDETNSNFGFNLAIWDKLLGTYRAEPRAGHENLVIGIPGFRTPRQCAALPGMLAIPFQSGDSGSPYAGQAHHEPV